MIIFYASAKIIKPTKNLLSYMGFCIRKDEIKNDFFIAFNHEFLHVQRSKTLFLLRSKRKIYWKYYKSYKNLNSLVWSSHLLLPSDSPPEEDVWGAAAESDVSSRRVCNDGARNVLLAAAATAAADKTGFSSRSASSSSSLAADTPKPAIAAVARERSSSLIMCKIRITIFPTASSATTYSKQ